MHGFKNVRCKSLEANIKQTWSWSKFKTTSFSHYPSYQPETSIKSEQTLFLTRRDTEASGTSQMWKYHNFRSLYNTETFNTHQACTADSDNPPPLNNVHIYKERCIVANIKVSERCSAGHLGNAALDSAGRSLSAHVHRFVFMRESFQHLKVNAETTVWSCCCGRTQVTTHHHRTQGQRWAIMMTWGWKFVY